MPVEETGRNSVRASIIARMMASIIPIYLHFSRLSKSKASTEEIIINEMLHWWPQISTN